MESKTLGRARRRMLTTSALFALGCGQGILAQGAFAQQAATAPQADEADRVVIVGSQISGADATGALPVSIVGDEYIAALGATSGDDLFRSIPEAGDITFNTQYLGGGNANASRGDISTVSLRGLAQGNTLLLINGRRSVLHPMSQTDNATPVFGYNTNAIPVAGLARVEILKDGAAALYGSDAVAGVVNNVLRSDYNGLTVDLQYGAAEDTHLQEFSANMLFGSDFDDGRGNISVFLGMTDRTALRASDYDFTASLDNRSFVAGTPWANVAAFNDTSTASAWGAFQVYGQSGAILLNGTAITDATGYFHVQPVTNGGCTYVVSSTLCFDDGNVTGTADANLRQDTNKAFSELSTQPGVTRYNAFSFLNYDFTETLSGFAELGFYTARTKAFTGPASPLGSTPIVIPKNNYWNPFGPVGSPNRLSGLTNVPAAGLDLYIRNYSFTDAGAREVVVDNYQARMLAGLRGDVAGWDWETALLYNEAVVSDAMDNGSATLIQRALALSTPSAYNPFTGGDPSNPSGLDTSINASSITDTFTIAGIREDKTSLALWDLKVSRPDLFALPAGNVGIAAGVEFRRETFEDNRDSRQDGSTPFIDAVTGVVYTSDLLGHSLRGDVKGSRDVSSAYVEFAVPVISPDMQIPLVQAVDVQLAGRYEDYSDVGSVAKPKVAASWDVFDGLRFRTSWSEGFKAPNLEVVNIGVQTGSNSRVDYIKCEADLRAGRIASFSACNRTQSAVQIVRGNTDLKPEESTSFSYGMVFEPQFIPAELGQLTFTVDRWSIEQEGVVGTMSAQQSVNLDYIMRLQGQTSPGMQRLAPTSAEIAAFAGTGLAPAGTMVSTTMDFVNLLPIETGGVDFGIAYDVSLGSFGDLSLGINASRLLKYYQAPSEVDLLVMQAVADGITGDVIPIVGAGDLIERDGRPKWKWSANASWSLGNWKAGLFTQYIGEVFQSSVLNSAGNPWLVEDSITANAYGEYAFGDEEGFAKGTTVRLGVRNLTNEAPPFADGGYLASLYQPVGRYWYGSIKKEF